MLRTVQFWRLAHRDGSPMLAPFPGGLVVRELQSAEAQGRHRYRTCWDGTEILGQGLGVSPHPLVALYRTRRDNLPRLDDNGQIARLPLTKAQALAEPSFFAFLPRNVIALLFNNDGPRASRLADYLNAKLGCDVSLQPVYREDLADVLAEMRMTAVELSIPAAQVPMLGGGDDWAEVLDNASRLVNDGGIRIRVSVGRTGNAAAKQAKSNRIRDLVGLLRNRSQDQMGHLGKARVEGKEPGSSNPITVDLLNQKFVARVEVPGEALSDPTEAASAAMDAIDAEWQRQRGFLAENTPPVDGDADPGLVGDFVDTPEDERDDQE